MNARATDDLGEALRVRAGVAPGERSDFSVRSGERNVNVRYATDSDDEVTRVTLSCGYDFVARELPSAYRGAATLRATRPMAIELRAESAGDVSAKARGLAVEWQSSDPTFDDAVYVASPTTDPAVLEAVLGPPARSATVDLLALGFDTIEIDADGDVRASIPASALRRASGPSGEERAQRALDAFAQLVSRLPVVEHSGVAHAAPPLAKTTKLLGAVGLIGWLLNVGYTGAVLFAVSALLGRANLELTTATALACIAAGLLGGWLGARVYGGVMAGRVRGRSDAHTRVGRAKLAAFGGFSVLVYTAALAAAVVVSAR